MAEEATNAPKDRPQADKPPAAPVVHVGPAPHISPKSSSTRRMMLDVLIALVPVVGVSLYVFRWYAAIQLGICIAGCIVAELVFTAMRGRRAPLEDFSAIVTGAILALSLPGTAPWYVGTLGAFVAIGLGKVIFGGLGGNIFNPAMVGRAFVMIAFTGAMAAGGYVDGDSSVQALTQATPMTVMEDGKPVEYLPLLLGTTNGSLGETSALACLVGGLFLCIRRTAAWQLPAGALLAVAAIGGLKDLLAPSNMTVLHHLLGGALMLGAFYIITDPVSSPLTPWGRFIGGLIFGALVMLMRLLSAYPEGVMFAVLLMNAVVPLINRWTIPRPVGGPVPLKK